MWYEMQKIPKRMLKVSMEPTFFGGFGGENSHEEQKRSA